MFDYTLPCGGFNTVTTMTDTGIKFDPPVYEQRYCATIQILEDARWKSDIKKVTEFGCSEMRLFQLIRRIETIEHILQVDIDGVILKNNLVRTNPLISDYIRQRERPLHVKVLQGSIADSTEELKHTDAVIALELIEHVYDDVLSKIPNNIFGFMQPKLVIFSTPNSDYNCIFTRFNPLLPNGFRHLDHKFEWTREEFKSWCLDITEKFPNYMFSLMGVGDPPEGFESVGHVSQIAIFVRKDVLGMSVVESQFVPEENPTPYINLHAVDFPFYVDPRTPAEKIWQEIEFELHSCTKNEDNYDNEKYAYKIAISELLKRTEYLGGTREIVDELLKEHKKRIENDYVIVEEEEEEEDSQSESFEEQLEEMTITERPETAEEEIWET